jgi:hypothetical protein
VLISGSLIRALDTLRLVNAIDHAARHFDDDYYPKGQSGLFVLEFFSVVSQ